jgi:hypothetical protein
MTKFKKMTRLTKLLLRDIFAHFRRFCHFCQYFLSINYRLEDYKQQIIKSPQKRGNDNAENNHCKSILKRFVARRPDNLG